MTEIVFRTIDFDYQTRKPGDDCFNLYNYVPVYMRERFHLLVLYRNFLAARS